LAHSPIEVGSEPVETDPWSSAERRDGRLGADESMPPERGQLTDRDSIPGHDERLAPVQLAHDLATVVA